MITVNWDNNDKTIIIWNFGETWTRQEFYSATELSRRLALSVPHTIHIIVEMTFTTNTPTNIISLARNGIKTRTDNLGKIVVITQSQLWNRLYQYMKVVYPDEWLPVFFVPSYDEAIKQLSSFFNNEHNLLVNQPIPSEITSS